MTLPLTCSECGIEKGWPCSYLDPDYDAQHHDRRPEVCALAKADAADLMVALVPRAHVPGCLGSHRGNCEVSGLCT